jgi:hypothetical protein
MGSKHSAGAARDNSKKKTLTEEELLHLKRRSTCRYCDKLGHWESECRKKMRDEGKRESRSNDSKSSSKKKSKRNKSKSEESDQDSDSDSENEDNPTEVRAYLDNMLGRDRVRAHYGCNVILHKEQEHGGEVRFKPPRGSVKPHSGILAYGYGCGTDGHQKNCSGQRVKAALSSTSSICPQFNGGVVTLASAVGDAERSQALQPSDKFVIAPDVKGANDKIGKFVNASAPGGAKDKFVFTPTVTVGKEFTPTPVIQGVPGSALASAIGGTNETIVQVPFAEGAQIITDNVSALGDTETSVTALFSGAQSIVSALDCAHISRSNSQESDNLIPLSSVPYRVQDAQADRHSGVKTDELRRCLEEGLSCWGGMSRDVAVAAAKGILKRDSFRNDLAKPSIELKQIIIRSSVLFKQKFGVDGLFPKFKVRMKKGGTSRISSGNNSLPNVCSGALPRDRNSVKLGDDS